MGPGTGQGAPSRATPMDTLRQLAGDVSEFLTSRADMVRNTPVLPPAWQGLRDKVASGEITTQDYLAALRSDQTIQREMFDTALNNPFFGPLVSGIKAAGLPMDEVSRMARAKEMGFDTDIFHGTGGQPVTEFAPDSLLKYIERDYFGASFTDNPREASHYAQIRSGGTPNVMPIKAVGNRIYTMPRTEEDAIRSPQAARDVRAKLASQGYAGIRFEDGEVKVFDPSAIRSRFAKFDPKKAGSADLMAALGPLLAVMGIGAGAMGVDREQEALP